MDPFPARPWLLLAPSRRDPATARPAVEAGRAKLMERDDSERRVLMLRVGTRSIIVMVTVMLLCVEAFGRRERAKGETRKKPNKATRAPLEKLRLQNVLCEARSMD